jgi:hypothetical protein
MLIPKLQKRPKRRREITFEGKPVTMRKLREEVFFRDGHECIAAKLYGIFGHECRGGLTLEHVTKVHGPHDGRHDNERHTITLCLGLNGIALAESPLRDAMRRRLRALYPECSPG